MNGRGGRQRSGFVLSDGASRGAYEVGVLQAVLSGHSPSTGYRPIEPVVYTGTSVGAFNAAVMSSQPGTAAWSTANYLATVWRDRLADRLTTCGNGVYRLRGLPLQGLQIGCLLRPFTTGVTSAVDAAYLSARAVETGVQFVTEGGTLASRLLESVDLTAVFSPFPLAQSIEATIDFAGIQRSGRRLATTATNWDLGVARVFHTEEFQGRLGRAAILASASIPGLFPAVKIEGALYVDGGLLINTPLKPALRAGATDLHVVYLDPLVRNSDLGSSNTFDAMVRSYSIMTAQRLRTDIATARRINRALEIIDSLQRGERIPAESGSLQAIGVLDDVVEREATGKQRKLITLHQYRPATDLGGASDLLNFDIGNIDSLIAQGYHDAVHHDCRAQSCITIGRRGLLTLPPARPRPRAA